jgi:hypothetical protein
VNLIKISQVAFSVGAVLCIACTTAAGREQRIIRRLERMAVGGQADWAAARGVLADCRDQTYQFGVGARQLVFSAVGRNEPLDIVTLIREVAEIPIPSEERDKSLPDSVAVSNALSWLSRHHHPAADPIAFKRLAETDTWVLMTALRVLKETEYWSATESVEEALRRMPKDPPSLVPNVNGLKFLAGSPATDSEVCRLRELTADLERYCAGRTGTSKPLECEDLETVWKELEQRFKCSETRAERLARVLQ